MVMSGTARPFPAQVGCFRGHVDVLFSNIDGLVAQVVPTVVGHMLASPPAGIGYVYILSVEEVAHLLSVITCYLTLHASSSLDTCRYQTQAIC